MMINGINIDVLFIDIKKAKSILKTEIHYDKSNHFSVVDETDFSNPNDVHNDLLYVASIFCNPNMSLATNISVISHGFTTMHYNGQDNSLSIIDIFSVLEHLSKLGRKNVLKRIEKNKYIMQKIERLNEKMDLE